MVGTLTCCSLLLLTINSELIDTYLNGPRTLSNERLSYLVVSSDDKSQDAERNYDFLICATHFLGDGMALHSFANDFFGLLGGTLDDKSLEEKLSNEWSERCLPSKDTVWFIPPQNVDSLINMCIRRPLLLCPRRWKIDYPQHQLEDLTVLLQA
jgi:hypothetical protein